MRSPGLEREHWTEPVHRMPTDDCMAVGVTPVFIALVVGFFVAAFVPDALAVVLAATALESAPNPGSMHPPMEPSPSSLSSHGPPPRMKPPSAVWRIATAGSAPVPPYAYSHWTTPESLSLRTQRSEGSRSLRGPRTRRQG